MKKNQEFTTKGKLFTDKLKQKSERTTSVWQYGGFSAKSNIFASFEF